MYLDSPYRRLDTEELNVTIRYNDWKEVVDINEIPFEGPYKYNIFTEGPSPFLCEVDNIDILKKDITDNYLFSKDEIKSAKVVIFASGGKN
ncbi:MAG TPA: hypothetical protein ENG87_04660 [Candidatus Pacearchaeota archaeon]|nr:hypothetical protein [Candidatus Pacearchaeota archaeon]